MKTVHAALVLSVWLTVGNLVAHAGPSNEWAHMRFIVPQGYVCHHTTSPLTIDGHLDEPDW